MKINFSISDLFLLLIIAFLIGFPALQYSAISIQGVFNNKRLCQVGLLILLGILLISVPRLQKYSAQILSKLPNFFIYIFISIFLLGFISSFFVAEFQDWALLEVGHYLLMMLITIVVAGISYSNPQRVLYYTLCALIGVVALYLLRVGITYMLYQFGDYPLWPGSELSIGLFGFADKRFFNHIQTWTLPLLIALGWYYWNISKRKILSYGVLILVIGWGVLLLASGGRGTVFGVIISFLILIFVISLRWKFLGYNCLIAFLTFIWYFLFFEVLAGNKPNVSNTTVLRSSSTGRIEVWSELVPDLLVNPFLGYGPMHYASINIDNWMASPHNWFLQFAYEWGILVAITLLGIVIYGFYHFIKQVRLVFHSDRFSAKERWIRFGLCWSLLAVFIHSFFSGLINSQLSQVWFLLIVGMSIGIYYNNKQNLDFFRELEPTVFLQRILVLLILISFACFFNWGYKHKLNQEKINEVYLEKYDSDLLYPRYWQQGKIGLNYELPDIRSDK